jgi:hypothetical protein
MTIQTEIDKLLIYTFGDKYKVKNEDFIRQGNLFRQGKHLYIQTGKNSNKRIRQFKSYQNLFLYVCGLFDMRLEKIQDVMKAVKSN